MTICPWKESYCVGDVTIDSQHEYLFALANDLVEASTKDELTRNAMKLFRYVREHFDHEEAVMRASAYPDLRLHVALHDELISRLSAIAEDIRHERWSQGEVQQFMNQWLAVHIVREDAKLAGFLPERLPQAQVSLEASVAER